MGVYYFYNMANAQQLDLFGAMMAAPAVETKPIQPATPKTEEENILQEPEILFVVEEALPSPIAEKIEEPIIEFLIDEPAPTIEEKITPATTTPKPSFVFEDKKIGVKVTSISKKNSTYTLPNKSKRGRKSFKEMDAEVDLIEVPDEETLSKKLYYSISEVASWFKVNTSLIRAWSTQFDIIQPRKNRKGDRLFRAEDVKNLQIIYYLLRSRKFSVDGAKKYLKSNKKQVDTNLTLIQSLTKFRSFLLEMKANLEA
jgi:DNA-binding transcriptional MerR regulator